MTIFLYFCFNFLKTYASISIQILASNCHSVLQSLQEEQNSDQAHFHSWWTAPFCFPFYLRNCIGRSKLRCWVSFKNTIFFLPVSNLCFTSICIERFIDGQAFSRSYDLAPPSPQPPPTAPTLSPVSKLRRRHTGRLRKRDNLPTGGGGGAKSYYSKKAWPSINHSLLSVPNHHGKWLK